MYIFTKRQPTQNPKEFSEFILNYPKIDSKATYQTFCASSQKKFPENGKFELTWLARSVKFIDHLYYKNQLMAYISLLYGRLKIQSTVSEASTAGYVVENNEAGLDLCLNQKLFIDLFAKKNISYHAAGLLCSDKFSCLSQVLLHECIHLALTVIEKLGFHDDNRHHGQTFMHIARNMLGHCDATHGLVAGLTHTESLCDIRKNLKIGQDCLVFFKCKFVDGKITDIFRKKVEVEIQGLRYIIHVGLIKNKT